MVLSLPPPVSSQFSASGGRYLTQNRLSLIHNLRGLRHAPVGNENMSNLKANLVLEVVVSGE